MKTLIKISIMVAVFCVYAAFAAEAFTPLRARIDTSATLLGRDASYARLVRVTMKDGSVEEFLVESVRTLTFLANPNDSSNIDEDEPSEDQEIPEEPDRTPEGRSSDSKGGPSSSSTIPDVPSSSSVEPSSSSVTPSSSDSTPSEDPSSSSRRKPHPDGRSSSSVTPSSSDSTPSEDPSSSSKRGHHPDEQSSSSEKQSSSSVRPDEPSSSSVAPDKRSSSSVKPDGRSSSSSEKQSSDSTPSGDTPADEPSSSSVKPDDRSSSSSETPSSIPNINYAGTKIAWNSRHQTLSIFSRQSGNAKFAVVDVQGVTLGSGNVFVSRGSTSLSLDYLDLPKGNFVVKFEMGSTKLQQTIAVTGK